jgi:hypothetical protein
MHLEEHKFDGAFQQALAARWVRKNSHNSCKRRLTKKQAVG